MDYCEYTLKLLGTAAGTYFWLWYLTWEAQRAKGMREHKNAWWERDIMTLFKHYPIDRAASLKNFSLHGFLCSCGRTILGYDAVEDHFRKSYEDCEKELKELKNEPDTQRKN